MAMASLAIANGNPKNGSKVEVGEGVIVGVREEVDVGVAVSVGRRCAVSVCAAKTVPCTLVATPLGLRVQARVEMREKTRTIIGAKEVFIVP